MATIIRRGIRGIAVNRASQIEPLEARTLLSSNLFVVNNGAESIQEFSGTGATIDGSLITNLRDPNGIAVSGNDIFETNYAFGTIGEYTTSGAVVKATLISGLDHPESIAVDGSDLFITCYGSSSVAEYTTSGTVVNASLITGVSEPTGIAVSGPLLYVASADSGVNQYTLSGLTLATPLVAFDEPSGLVVVGSDLFVVSNSDGTVGEFNAPAGSSINPDLISGLDAPFGIATDGTNLFVTTSSGVGEFTTAGATVNASLISGVTEALGIAVVNTTPPPPAGSADATFNNGNPVDLNFAAQASALTPTAQIVLAGLNPDSGGSSGVVEELNSDGSLNSAFGTGGIVTDSSTADEAFYGVVAESDGTIVAAGTSNHDLLLAGFNAGGSVDTSFGSDGRVVLPISGASSTTAYGITLDAAGNIVVVGSAGGQFIADRFTAAGQQDPAFNGGAPLVFGSASDGDLLGKVAVASTGDIVAAGASDGSVVAVRLMPSGALDSTFGSGGIFSISQLAAPNLLGQLDYTEGLTIDSEGRILIANTDSAGDFAIARLTSAGYLDSTFAAGGIAVTGFSGVADADFVAVQPDGSQILVAGTNTVGNTVQTILAAYTPAGALNTSFGSDGAVIVSTGLVSSSLVRLPQAEGIGSIIQQVYGTLSGGAVIVGKSAQGSTSGSGSVQRFNALPPTSAALPTGTLAAAIAGKLPAAAVGGSKLNDVLSVKLRNPGTALISGPVTVTIYLSLGQSLGSAIPLSSVAPNLRLKGRASTVVRFRITSIPSLPMGRYYLVADVNAPDGSETATAGAVSAISPPFASIALTAVTPPRGAIIPGRPTALTFILQDLGNVLIPAITSATLSDSVASTGAGAQAIVVEPLRIRLKPLQKARYRLSFKVPATLAAGNYYLLVGLDLSTVADILVSNISAISSSTLIVK